MSQKSGDVVWNDIWDRSLFSDYERLSLTITYGGLVERPIFSEVGHTITHVWAPCSQHPRTALQIVHKAIHVVVA